RPAAEAASPRGGGRTARVGERESPQRRPAPSRLRRCARARASRRTPAAPRAPSADRRRSRPASSCWAGDEKGEPTRLSQISPSIPAAPPLRRAQHAEADEPFYGNSVRFPHWAPPQTERMAKGEG